MNPIQEKIDEAVTAQEAGDYPGAIKKLRSASILLAGQPNQTVQGRGNVTWDRRAIENMIADLQRLQNSATGIRRVPHRWGGPRT